MKSQDFTENRHGYMDGDYHSIPRRNGFSDVATIHALMADNRVAYRIYETEFGLRLAVLADYYLIKRKRKGAKWELVETCLASCLADAIGQMGGNGDYSLNRIVVLNEWVSIQTKQAIK
jgi:hypothetical protein